MLKDYDQLVDDIRARGGDVVGVCAQSQVEANKFMKKLELNYRLVADPTCEIAKLLNEKGWVESVIKDATGEAGENIESTVGYRYAVAMLQPGVVSLKGPTDEEDEPTVLLTWGSKPSAKNINGSIHRLKAPLAWTIIQKSLTGDLSDSHPPEDQEDDMMPFPLPVFYMILVANGNFIAPKAFVADSEGNFNKSVIMVAMAKLVAFVVLSIVVLALVPIVGVILLGLYCVYAVAVVVPKINRWRPK